jgi:hypothetical protein
MGFRNLFFLMSFCFWASSCSSGFDLSPSGLNSPANLGAGVPTPGSGTNAPVTWTNLNMNGVISGGVYDQTPVISLDKVNKLLILRLPMFANPGLNDISMQFPITQLPGATFGLASLPNGSSALVLTIPLSYVMKGVSFLPQSTLPSGDPLPGIPDGELPGLAIQLNISKKVQANIYLGVATVAVFINSPVDPYFAVQLPIRTSDSTKTLGYFATVPAKKPTYDGGFFIAAQIPGDIARIIDDVL